MVCRGPSRYGESQCSRCAAPHSRDWCVGEKSEALEKLLNVYKFGRAKSAVAPIVDLLDSVVPQLPQDIVVVPIPTVAAHIRQRGYDHCDLVAREFAKRRNHQFSTVIERVGSDRQRGATRAQRIRQAKRAFRCQKALNGSTYLLIDDVYTTGATMTYASKTLLDAGAGSVWIAVVARQPIDS